MRSLSLSGITKLAVGITDREGINKPWPRRTRPGRPTVDLFLALLLVFVAARAAGEAMEKIHRSPRIGEVLAGILLGPMILGWVDPNPTTELGASLGVVANLGVFVLVMLAGIELGREGLRQAFKERSMIVAFVEFFLPFALGYSLGHALQMSFVQSLFLGTALAVTALPVSVRILLDLNLLHSRLGRAIVSVALVNDLVAFAMLGLVVQFQALAGPPESTTFTIIPLKNVLFRGLRFAIAGLKFALVFEAWPLILAVTATAFVGKLLGGLMGGRVAGFRGSPLLALGVGLNARGMMELLLAQVGLATGIINANVYSALVVMTLTTTLLTPPLMKRLLRRFKAQDVLPAVSRPVSARRAEAQAAIPERDLEDDIVT